MLENCIQLRVEIKGSQETSLPNFLERGVSAQWAHNLRLLLEDAQARVTAHVRRAQRFQRLSK
jgi:hypothetical protein